MSAVQKLMQNLAGQYSAGAGSPGSQDTLGPWAKALMAATLTVSSAVAVSDVQAQQQIPSQQRDLMPERSAVQWGGHLGAALGSLLTQGVQDHRMRQTLSGVATEVGRNAGRMAVGGLYQQGSQGSQPAGQGSAQKVQSSGSNATSESESQELEDQLDTAGLDAAFAYEEVMRVGALAQRGLASPAQVAQAQHRFQRSHAALSHKVQAAGAQGHDVGSWSQMSGTLSQRVVNENEVALSASRMAERLNRPGGPGYRDPRVGQGSLTLSELRERLARQQQEQEQQEQRRHDAPGMR